VTVLLSDLSFGRFLFVVVLATLFSLLVFRHASRNGSRHATAWGVGAFLAAGIIVPAYFIHHFWTRRR
jgi:hypothetical protein